MKQFSSAVGCVFALAAILGTSRAHADVFDTFGAGPRAAAMAGAMTADADDHSATFYNPALLVHRRDANFALHANYYRPLTSVAAVDKSRSLDCSGCTPPDTMGVGLGLVGPLGGKLKDRVAVGVSLYVPVQRLTAATFPEPSAPYWYHYHTASERLELFAALSIRLTNWLTIGGGVNVAASLLGSGSVDRVDLFSKRVEARSLQAELATKVAPVVGVHVMPLPRLRFGATYRGEMAVQVRVPASVDLGDVGTLSLLIDGIAQYSPHTVQFGLALDLGDDVTVALDGEWQRWSNAPSPYKDLTIDLSGEVLSGLGLDQALDVKSDAQPPGFQDTLTGRLGFEFRAHRRFTARAGAYYRPTPVPQQNTSGTNILDGNTLGLTAGLAFNFDDPLEIFGRPIIIELSGLAGFVLPRTANKSQFDSVPTYSYSATLAGASAAMRYDF